MPRLNIIGAGRVGQTLGRLWQQGGHWQVQDVLTSRLTTAQAACAFIGGGKAVAELAAMRPAAVWMLAVPDAQIASCQALLAKAVPHQHQPGTAPLVFHCSGAQSSHSLAALAARGWQTASAHCILSFASAELATQQFAGTGCALEGAAPAVAVLQTAFAAIGARCFTVRAEDKLLYHAAAVFATNFVPVLQYVAEQAWSTTGVPPELLPHLRQSLLGNAVANIARLGPVDALTGPAVRGDVAAIEEQAQVVAGWDAKAGAAYVALSDLALRMAKARTETKPSAAKTR